jgi:truncated hemoglobin YjbI
MSDAEEDVGNLDQGEEGKEDDNEGDIIDTKIEEKEEKEDDDDVDNDDEDDEPTVPLKCPCPASAVHRPVNPCSAAISIHPLQRLQYRAAVLSGVPIERAYEIDEVNISKTLNEYYTSELAERFYKRILDDRDEWFTSIWKDSNMEDLQSDFSEYLLQRLGGESYYSSRKGNPNLIVRHAKFEMSARVAEKWLGHMYDVLEDMEVVDELPVINETCREILMNFFRFTAYLMVAAQEEQWINFQKRDDDDVPFDS